MVTKSFKLKSKTNFLGLYDVVEVKKSKDLKVAQYIDEQSANNSVDKNLREDYFDLYEKGYFFVLYYRNGKKYSYRIF